MILNWEMKPYLRATSHSQGPSHCGPSVHPGYQFGTEETNGSVWYGGNAIVTEVWLVVVGVMVVCVGPLSPCNS